MMNETFLFSPHFERLLLPNPAAAAHDGREDRGADAEGEGEQSGLQRPASVELLCRIIENGYKNAPPQLIKATVQRVKSVLVSNYAGT